MATQTKAPKYPATKKQVNFILTLCEERGMPVPPCEGMSKYQATQTIKGLLATPMVEAPVSLVDMAKAITHGAIDAEPVFQPLTVPTFTVEELRAISGAFFVEEAEVGERSAAGDEALAKVTAFLAAVDAGVKTQPAPAAKPASLTLDNAQQLVPEGRYAVTGKDGATDFYKVEHGKPGTKWASFLFLSQQCSDDYVPVKAVPVKLAVLAKIVADGILDAAKRYGTELGVCGVCAKTLTDPESIAKGIGPVCESKLGAF